ncbi:MAG: Rid family hydrolase [Mycobacterium sp.]|uniref:Rid family hydrolase n=1 Tax=Mycobacterium sp. TaxID=1785 RepID=UPI003F99E0C1
MPASRHVVSSGSDFESVVGYSRAIFVTDISRWREVGAVHAEVFGEIRPAATMVEVSALIAPGLLVEIEADAYVGS